MTIQRKSKAEKSTWGGKRDGAGRPKSSQLVSHLSRPRVERRKCPVRITLKLRSGLPSLREEGLYEVFEKSALRARRFGLRIIEFTVLEKSIHLICEFKKSEELEKAFKSLNTSLAVAIKKKVKADTGSAHKGPVFLGRYHMQLLSHPDEMKLALREVLTLSYSSNNSSEKINLKSRDPFSSGLIFEKWQALLGRELSQFPALRESSSATGNESAKERILKITASPQFWLSQAGWLKSSL